ncbi:redoxin family protein [Sphingomonas sp.]|uniref:redoxin family protein n=1 Tax=Sphingomonas sp. TaxID=28214 RepID=UPI002BFFF2F3|nr:redoxin family protein [Sphingomonas sp.]HWK37109.1 redoxin family protein [Sphingomonas sp.]
MKRWLIWVPFVVFVGLMWLVAGQLLAPADRTVRSAMVDQPLPTFALPANQPDKPGLATADFGQGQPRLLNVFASWCVPCIAEAPQLMALKQAGARIDAVAVRDTPANVARFLNRYGDPYERIGDDKASQVQLALGSSGVPETFVIDGKGRIVAQHIGEIRADEVPGILAMLRKAR